jgi:uncharacterized membrane protein
MSTLLLVGAVFIAKYVLYYFMNYSERGFGVANPRYWGQRFWLILHISAGSTALLAGPLQFSRTVRQRWTRFHRVLGRAYLIAIACASIASIRLALTTTFDWGFASALLSLAFVWLTASGMAWYAILRRQVQIHQEWMIRSYIATFGFVSFRILENYTPISHLKPAGERAAVVAWSCWAIPMFIAEIWMQLLKMRKVVPAKH